MLRFFLFIHAAPSRLAALLAIAACCCTPANATEPAGSANATSVAMRVLREECLACHNPEKKKGGLLLTSREAAIAGGDSGPALVANQSEKSLLVQSLSKEADPHMPPKKQLKEEEIAAIRTWIDGGAAWDAKLLVAQIATTRPVQFRELPANYQPAMALALRPDEKMLAVARGNRVLLHDLTNPDKPIVKTLQGARDVIQALAWSDDGKHLAVGDFGRALVWEMESNQPSKVLEGLIGRTTALLFLPKEAGLLVADGAAGAGGRLHLFKTSESTPSQTVAAHADSVMAMACDPAGKVLATAGGDKVVRLWELPSLNKTGDLEGHTGRVTAVAFGPGGTLLATASADRDMKVWDVKTRDRKQSVGPHPAAISAIAWTQKEEIVVACEDGSIHLNKPDVTKPGRALTAAKDTIYALAAGADGKTIFGSCHDGNVYVWGPAGKVMPPLPTEEKVAPK